MSRYGVRHLLTVSSPLSVERHLAFVYCRTSPCPALFDGDWKNQFCLKIPWIQGRGCMTVLSGSAPGWRSIQYAETIIATYTTALNIHRFWSVAVWRWICTACLDIAAVDALIRPRWQHLLFGEKSRSPALADGDLIWWFNPMLWMLTSMCTSVCSLFRHDH